MQSVDKQKLSQVSSHGWCRPQVETDIERFPMCSMPLSAHTHAAIFLFFPITLCCFLILNRDPHDELRVPFPSDLRWLLLVLSMSVHFLVSCSSCLWLDLAQEMALFAMRMQRTVHPVVHFSRVRLFVL